MIWKRKSRVSKPSAEALLCLTLALSVAFLLAGCGADNVQVTPVGVKDVPGYLMQDPGYKLCLPKTKDGKKLEDYSPDELVDGFNCSEAERAKLTGKVRGLQSAVRARQTAIKAVATP